MLAKPALVVARAGKPSEAKILAASSEVDAYLLAACDGDRRELERRVGLERERYPELTEAEHYRRVIRKVFAARESSSE